jgi:hypothetical protein
VNVELARSEPNDELTGLLQSYEQRRAGPQHQSFTAKGAKGVKKDRRLSDVGDCSAFGSAAPPAALDSRL